MIARFHPLTKTAALLALSFPQLAAAAEGEGFTSATVLEWDTVSQNALFQSSIGMANLVAMRTGQHDDIFNCINEWYGNPDLQAQRHQEILSVMADYPENHPQGIILAVIEKECGKFDGS